MMVNRNYETQKNSGYNSAVNMSRRIFRVITPVPLVY